METVKELKLAGKVMSNGSDIRTNEVTGGTYQYHNVLIKEGPLKGKTVPGKRTLVNVNGDEKSPVQAGDDVQVYVSVVPDRKNPSKRMYFFEISTNNSISNDEVDALLGNMFAQEAEDIPASQQIG